MSDQPGTENGAVYLTDLGRCQPASSLSKEPKRRAWHVQAYEAESFSGKMLCAGEETAAPEVRLALGREGWHRIFIGVYPEHRGNGAIEVRLSRDAAFSTLLLGPESGNDGPHGHRVYDLWWKDAELSGQQLHVRQLCAPTGRADEPAAVQCERTKLAYVKLLPLSGEEVAKLQEERQRPEGRNLFAHNDAHGYLFLLGAATEEAVRREIEPYRDTDFARLYWECGAGDLMFCLGSGGRLPTCDGIEDFDRRGDRLHAETWRSFREQGLDPLDAALSYAHEIGLSFHASYRTAGFFYPAPLEQWNAGSLYFTRPDLRMVGKDGRAAPRVSYAFADTRRYVIDLLLEVARRPIDGVCILYNRRPPLVDYEEPLVSAFMEEYGEDPRRLADDDPRWLSSRSAALTAFHRELRRALDRLAEEQGRERILISACVLNEEENLFNGLDIGTWVREGLIDTLIPYTDAAGLDSMRPAWEDAEAVRRFVGLVEGSGCQLALNVMPRHMAPEAFRVKAASLYALGVDNLFFWDSAGPYGRANHSAGWNALRRLGRRGEIEEWMRAGEPDLSPATTPLLRVGAYDLTYQTPG